MLFGTLLQAAAAVACSSLQVRPEIWIYECGCPCEDGSIPLPDIVTVSGTIVLSNGRATPELASLVVELEAKVGGRFTPVARRVLNEAGDDVVETCDRLYADSVLPGSLDFVDEDGNPIPFASIKNLPEGRVSLSYVASFAGNIPGIEPGGRARVRTITTLIDTDASRTCSIDANNDGSIDDAVKTHSDRSTVTLPEVPIVLPCPA